MRRADSKNVKQSHLETKRQSKEEGKGEQEIKPKGNKLNPGIPQIRIHQILMDKMTRQTYKSWAGKTAQEINHIFHKRDGLSLNQRLHVQLDTVVHISDLSAAGHRGVHP